MDQQNHNNNHQWKWFCRSPLSVFLSLAVGPRSAAADVLQVFFSSCGWPREPVLVRCLLLWTSYDIRSLVKLLCAVWWIINITAAASLVVLKCKAEPKPPSISFCFTDSASHFDYFILRGFVFRSLVRSKGPRSPTVLRGIDKWRHQQRWWWWWL